MKTLWAIPLILWLGPAMLVAQPQSYPDADSDVEQGRGVARVSVMNGEITMQRGDSGEWVAAVVNAPLMAGDAVATGRGSRGEIQLDSDNVLRLGENTEVRLASLDGGRYQLQVSNGLITYRVFRNLSAEVEINTPAVAVRPSRPGSYRIEVQPGGETEITVRDGEAEVFSNQGSERLRPGRTMLARPAGTDGVEVQELNAAGPDEWDRWNQERDNYFERSQSYNYVPPGVYGAEDLDRNGDWRTDDENGAVWYPRVSGDWAPYSNGRWVWADWYGWTWVSYDSWGWAPFHYGRWSRHPSYGWGWYPGQRRVRAHWSPALVGFFGWGGHSGVSVGVGFGYGNIGWVPLAPGERYYPWYGSRYYGARGSQVNVNIYNVNNIRGAYRNANVNGALLSTGAANFGRGQGRAERVNIGQVGNVGQIRGQVPIVPGRESLRFNDRTVTRPAAAQSDRGTRFVQRQAPAAVERVPFEQQRQQMGRAFQSGGAPTGNAPAANNGANNGWRRFGDQGVRSVPPAAAPDRNVDRSTRGGFNGQAAPPQTYQQTPDRSGNWRRFGDRGGNSSAPALTPQATPQVPAPAAPAYQGPGPDRARGRRFGDSNPQTQDHQPQAAPSFRTPAPAPQQQPQPQQWRQPAPERSRGDNNGGGGRPLQLNRPIIQQRAPQSSGSAPARGNSEGKSGGGRQSGRQSERGSDHGRR